MVTTWLLLGHYVVLTRWYRRSGEGGARKAGEEPHIGQNGTAVVWLGVDLLPGLGAQDHPPALVAAQEKAGGNRGPLEHYPVEAQWLAAARRNHAAPE